jgi:hypothetical protein
MDETNANPTIGKAINGGYDLFEGRLARCARSWAKCNRCRPV